MKDTITSVKNQSITGSSFAPENVIGCISGSARLVGDSFATSPMETPSEAGEAASLMDFLARPPTTDSIRSPEPTTADEEEEEEEFVGDRAAENELETAVREPTASNVGCEKPFGETPFDAEDRNGKLRTVKINWGDWLKSIFALLAV